MHKSVKYFNLEVGQAELFDFKKKQLLGLYLLVFEMLVIPKQNDKSDYNDDDDERQQDLRVIGDSPSDSEYGIHGRFSFYITRECRVGSEILNLLSQVGSRTPVSTYSPFGQPDFHLRMWGSPFA